MKFLHAVGSIKSYILQNYANFFEYHIENIWNNTFPTDLGSGNRIPTQGKVKKIPPQGRSAAGRNFLTFPRVGILFPLPKSVGNDIPVLFIKIAIYVVMGIVLSQGMHFYVLMGKTIPTRVRTFGIVFSQGTYFWNSFFPGYVFLE